MIPPKSTSTSEQVHGEIPHWLCVWCGAIQPGTDAYPESCWRCKKAEFIRDVLPPLLQAGARIALLPLLTLTICPCGWTVLHPDIGIGTVYEVDTATLRDGFLYTCGGCGLPQPVAVMDARSKNRPWDIPRPLPAALFTGSPS